MIILDRNSSFKSPKTTSIDPFSQFHLPKLDRLIQKGRLSCEGGVRWQHECAEEVSGDLACPFLEFVLENGSRELLTCSVVCLLRSFGSS